MQAHFLALFQMLEDRPSIDRRLGCDIIHQALEFVIDGVLKKCTVSQG
jgi:rRNA pseudouridine-1189 N-methylase Emg1 (Nep1/Mra1 family)